MRLVVPSSGVGSVSEAAQLSAFDAFARSDGERLRRVLVACYGVEVGNDVCADAMAYAWEHWERVRSMENPAGYLYRVAQSASRRHRRWRRPISLPPEANSPDDGHDPGLHAALAALKINQRACVVMVHVYDWTYQQTADALGMPVTSVRNHVQRGLAALRITLERR
jgi:DNA-directed RNA polymerase specialized sigma24 family protein